MISVETRQNLRQFEFFRDLGGNRFTAKSINFINLLHWHKPTDWLDPRRNSGDIPLLLSNIKGIVHSLLPEREGLDLRLPPLFW